MRSTAPLVAIILLLFDAYAVEASWLQYNTTTFEVVGAFASDTEMRITPETAPLEIPGVAVEAIAWPIPSGCLAGRKEWTLVTPPGQLPLVLKSGLVFFHSTSPLMTECQQVSNWRELQVVVNALLLGAIPDRVAASGALGHWTWYQGKCYDAPQNAQCQAWLANLVVMLSIVPGRGQGVTASSQGATLVQDALALKAAQSW